MFLWSSAASTTQNPLASFSTLFCGLHEPNSQQVKTAFVYSYSAEGAAVLAVGGYDQISERWMHVCRRTGSARTP